MNHEFELGYTPKNLKMIVNHLKKQGLTLQQIAERVGASKYTTLYNWMLEDLNNPQHRDMSHAKWLKIVELYHSTLD